MDASEGRGEGARSDARVFAFPAALVRDTNIKGYGRIWRLPLTFVIDRQGMLRKDGWYGDPVLDMATLESHGHAAVARPLNATQARYRMQLPPRCRNVTSCSRRPTVTV